jgi:hypothetical protein
MNTLIFDACKFCKGNGFVVVIIIRSGIGFSFGINYREAKKCAFSLT